jgi:hypothetical protein
MRTDEIYEYIVQNEVKGVEEEFFLRSIKNVCDSVPEEHTPLLLLKFILDQHRFSVKLQRINEEQGELLVESAETLATYENAMTEAQTTLTRLLKSREISSGH